MTEPESSTASGQPPPSSPLTAVGSLVGARDLEELAMSAALIPAQLLSASETVVVLRSSSADIVERSPAAISAELEQWALGELHATRAEEPARDGSRLAVSIDTADGWSGVIAVNVASPDEETGRGLVELGRIVSRCVAQIAGLKRRTTALEDARKSIGKGLHDLRTPLNSLRLGLHLLEPGLAGQDPQVVQRTHRAVDRLAALVTEMYEALHEKDRYSLTRLRIGPRRRPLQPGRRGAREHIVRMASDTSDYRIDIDSLGEVRVPAQRYWGAQTERSRQNFPIGHELMPGEVISALALIKKACARANQSIGALTAEQARGIEQVADEIIAGQLADEFPLRVWQTGSGTHTNMNVNEVIVNRAHVLGGGDLSQPRRELHPNDHVNKSQSSNDVFPTAMNIAAYRLLAEQTLPKIRILRDALARKAEEFMPIIKIGRTHMMDATPLRLGHEFSGYVAQLDQRLSALERSAERLGQLALGGTAVGTGINTPPGFAQAAIAHLRQLTGLPFVEASNHFAAQAAHDDLVEVSGALKAAAISLSKIAGDIRLMASGPRAGLAELVLRATEPGSSIMPGKTNPTQVEALTMVCAQVVGNDLAVSLAGMSGQLELNAYKPVMIFNVLMAARNLGDASQSFAERAVATLEADEQVIQQHLQRSLMLVTALNTHIGYEKAAKIAQKAHREHLTLRQAALDLGWVTEAEFDEWVDPRKMLGPTG